MIEQPFLWALLIPLTIWEMIWKGIGLWKAGRNKQLAWFVCIFIFNTVGILPIVYILGYQKKSKPTRKKKKR